MEIKKALITAAGFGSRFLPITKTIPKEMLPIIDKPIIHYIVQECAAAGIEEIIIVAAPDEVKIFEDYFYGHAENIRMLMQLQGKMDRWKKVETVFQLPKVSVIPENRTISYGNGRPVLTAKEMLKDEEAFVVCFGDDLVLSEISGVKQIVDYYKSQENIDGLLGVQKMSDEQIVKVGAVKLREGTSNIVESVIEKPKLEETPSHLGSYGRFIMSNKIFEYLTPEATGKDGEVWLQDANDLIAKNHNLHCFAINGEWLTTGDPDNYIIAQNKFYERNKRITN
ncbi:NTP transferase domain-containing protein [Candidatus Dojkabacteria bacterium]|uniref:UTP--glucose-1-phosphate uridylyltransferase n=1 Tax=Candidatus Dojkabacteria bacterium TaxID=2099670 RepID=A0A955RLE3_9BACT|nr:NTP transferase domain-containing protein [Candidatus Dojkabacteria bacterium]